MISEVQNLRKLDVDDLLIMKFLHEGQRPGFIAKQLKLTPPAISHRLLKYQEFIGNFFESPKHKYARRELTPRGEEVCRTAVKVLEELAGMCRLIK